MRARFVWMALTLLVGAAYGVAFSPSGFADDPPSGGLLRGVMPRDPEPGPPALPKTSPTPPANHGAATPPKPDLDATIAAAKAGLDRMRAVPMERLPAVTAEQANVYIDRLVALRAERARGGSERDRIDGEALRKRTETFEATWATNEAAIRENRRPPEVDAAVWPAMRDRFFRERSELGADLLDFRARIAGPVAELRAIDEKIAAARALAERVGRMGVASNELARRLQAARIALAERGIAELEARKAEQAGGPPRDTSLVIPAPALYGDLYIDGMNDVTHRMALAGRSAPPGFGGRADAPIPGWADRDAPLRASDRLKGRVAFIRAQLGKYEAAMEGVESTLEASDDAALDLRRSQLEAVDRQADPALSDPDLASARRATLDRLAAQQRDSRTERLVQAKSLLDLEITTWKTHLEVESQNLAPAEEKSSTPSHSETPPPR